LLYRRRNTEIDTDSVSISVSAAVQRKRLQ